MSLLTKCLNLVRPKIAGTLSWKKYEPQLGEINRRRAELHNLGDDELRGIAADGSTLTESFALAATAAERVLDQRPFDVQILGALAMADGKIAEMQTGEGKTLAATMAVYHQARGGGGFHALTANDYLARRDAEWMGGIYRFLGLSVAAVSQGMSAEERRRAYDATSRTSPRTKPGSTTCATASLCASTTWCSGRSRPCSSTKPIPS
jgi:preprotein translocase subunit SecA